MEQKDICMCVCVCVCVCVCTHTCTDPCQPQTPHVIKINEKGGTTLERFPYTYIFKPSRAKHFKCNRKLQLQCIQLKTQRE